MIPARGGFLGVSKGAPWGLPPPPQEVQVTGVVQTPTPAWGRRG